MHLSRKHATNLVNWTLHHGMQRSASEQSPSANNFVYNLVDVRVIHLCSIYYTRMQHPLYSFSNLPLLKY